MDTKNNSSSYHSDCNGGIPFNQAIWNNTSRNNKTNLSYFLKYFSLKRASERDTSTSVGMTKKLSWFTLVELIVVITILTILWTIWFTQMQGYSGSVRDSSRISNLVNLQKWLSLFQIKSGTYPMPENPVSITASGTPIGYQWFARDLVGNIATISIGGTKDPLDTGMYTTYSVNENQTKMQLMAFLEDGSNVSAFIPSAYAGSGTDYSKRYPITRWDSLGILLWNTGSSLNQPVQESGTGVDIMNTSTGYAYYFNKNTKISWTGTQLLFGYLTYEQWWTNKLIGYWNFDEWSGKILNDMSGNNLNGAFSWTISPTWTTGKIGKAMTFNGTGWWVQISDAPLIRTTGINPVSFSAWINTNDFGAMTQVMFSKKDAFNFHLPIGGWIRLGNTLGYGYTGTGTFATWSYVFVAVTYDLHNIHIYYNWQKVWQGLESAWLQTGWVGKNAYIWLAGNGTDGFFGSIDELRMYSRTLLDEEILALYNATK